MYAEISDVAVIAGRDPAKFTSVQKSQITAWIGSVERKIQKRLGDLSHLDPDTLKDVISEVVSRRFLNPQGRQYERIDDYSYGNDKNTARGVLTITDEEWALLTPDDDDRGIGNVNLRANPGYGPVATDASHHPARGWWQ